MLPFLHFYTATICWVVAGLMTALSTWVVWR
jgi:hypothetical protein